MAAGHRQVAELVLHLRLPAGERGLPIAVVAERPAAGAGGAGGPGWRELRVYHSLWPLTGGHRVRPPLPAPDPAVVLAGAVAAYQRALAAGDVEGVLAAYEPDAVTREPAGEPYAYRGRERGTRPPRDLDRRDRPG